MVALMYHALTHWPLGNLNQIQEKYYLSLI